MAVAVMVLCSQIAPVLLAQNSNPAPVSAEAVVPASATETGTVQLSSGAAEVLKLRRAQMSDEVVLAFIRSSGRMYPLSASEILYLRKQGVSDQVVAAMLNAQQKVATISTPAAPQPAPTESPAASANDGPQPASAAPTDVVTAPLIPPASADYGYPAPSYGDYDPYYYYPGYPAISFGFGFRGGYYGGYHRGGYYGGGYHGGFHGGGSRGGGSHSGGGGHR